ncbi:hypothetical protein V1282_003550 [Nitrobacteraceae bacterium AZCC 2146]
MTKFAPQSSISTRNLIEQPPSYDGDAIGISSPSIDGKATLSWWRLRSAYTFTDACPARLRQALAGMSLIAEPRWEAAVDGDAASAIGIALPAIGDDSYDGAYLDLAMSAVLLCALNGSAASALVLSHALRRSTSGRITWQAPAAAWLVRAAFGREDLSIKSPPQTNQHKGHSLTSPVLHATSQAGRRA